jgi:hypothetical protein
MSKRYRFLISTLIMVGLLAGVNVAPLEWRYRLMGVMGVLSAGLTAWSLWEGWKGITRVMTVVLPVWFCIGAAMFTFLLPETVPSFGPWSWSLSTGYWIGWGLRVAFWSAFVFGFYSLLLTENIFSVSAIRTIALARAAGAVGFLLTLVAGFFVYNAIWSFRLPFYWNAFWVVGLSFPLLLQGVWSARLSDKLKSDEWWGAVVLSLLIGQVALVLSFWPVSVAVGSLVLTTTLYVYGGMYQQYLTKRLFRKTVWEFAGVGFMVLMIVLFTTQWGG